MRRRALIGLLTLAGCGDLKYDDGPTSPNGSPPGSTTSLGSMAANVDNQQFSAPLQTPAIWRNDSFGFTAVNASDLTKIFALSLRLPGPGTYTVGSTYSPVVSYLEMDGPVVHRWTTAGRQGAGTVTISFLSDISASGTFSIELVPDSATMAAGFTGNRFLTNGTFNVSVMR